MSYKVIFVLNFMSCYFIMKLVSWSATPASSRMPLKELFLHPYLSLRTLRHTNLSPPSSSFKRLCIFGTLLICWLYLSYTYLLPLNYWKTLLIAPAVYFLTEAMGATGEVFYLWSRPEKFQIHNFPLTSKSLSHFWGRRWNRWVQDWLKDLSRCFIQSTPLQRIIITFIISGLFHEIMINLPYWIIFKKSYFGTMMAYFLIQAVGIWLDKSYLKRQHSYIRRIFLWIMVVGPSPLFINRPLLTFLGLNHE